MDKKDDLLDLKKSKMRVGWVSCRVRPLCPVDHCSAASTTDTLGEIAKIPSNNSWKCGGGDHKLLCTVNQHIVAGDFNSRAVEWGMPVSKTQDRLILEMCSRLDLKVANRGLKPTFHKTWHS